MAKRGFFAELNYQAQQAEKRSRQQQAQAVREQNAAARQHEKARKAAERARADAARASDSERKAAEKEAARLHVEARTAEVESMNKALAATYQDIDGLLTWTLDFDDHVDLESLRSEAVHPEFEPGALGSPLKAVPELTYPPQPTLEEPPAPSGLAAAFGGKKKHAEAVATSHLEHQQEVQEWEANNRQRYADHLEAVATRERLEAERHLKLAEAQATYEAQCAEREEAAAARNSELARFINDLAFDVASAIEDYVGIVLSNSVYPDSFPVDYEYSFELASRELTMHTTVPEPSTVPSVKEYRYTKSKDEISDSQLAVKAQKDRYASAVAQVAVRTLHEVFEADRSAKIRSISLVVGVDRIAPSTGLPENIPLVVVGADRQTFNSFDLANVVPSATLEHLGAAVSKSPFDLIAADTSRGVRQRGQ